MIKLLPYAIVGALCLCLGVYIGYGVLCPSQTNAIVKQLKKDDKKVVANVVKQKAREKENAKVKIVIQKVVDTTGCADVPNYELDSILLDAFNNPRP